MKPPSARERPPRVVWVTPEAGPLLRSGGGLRSARLISALTSRTEVDVVALGPSFPAEPYLSLTGARSVTSFPYEDRAVLTERFMSLTRHQPLSSVRCWSPAAARAVRTHLQSGAVVVAEHLRTVPYAEGAATFVVALQNVDSQLPGAFPVQPGLLHHFARTVEVRLTAAQERRLIRNPNATVTVTSPVDAVLLGGNPVVVPNGLDLPPIEATREKPRDLLLFVGNLEYEPNLEAVRWWATDIWPRFQAQIPLTVVGRGGESALGSLADHPGLTVIGEVDDVGPYLARARAAIVPLLSGSGTRIKLLESLAWRCPVVTTSKGAEGIPVQDGRHVLLADNPLAFAMAIERVWADAELRARLASFGRELARHYQWGDIGRQFADLVLLR